MKSKKHQKLYEHYVDVMGKEPIFSLQLKKDVLSDVAEQMKPVTTYVSSRRTSCRFGNFAR